MRIALLAYGTRGDIQPFLALAHTLQARGHDVRLTAPENYGPWIGKAGVPFTGIPIDVPALMAAEPAQRMLASGDIASFFKWLANEERRFNDPLNQALMAGTEGAELVVAHPLVQDRVAAIAASRRVGMVPLYFFPALPTGALPSPFITTRNLGLPPLNRMTHHLFDHLFWQTNQAPVQALRRELGVAPAGGLFAAQVRQRDLPCIVAYDEPLCPRPKDWGARTAITGAVDLPPALRTTLGEAELAPDLAAFLGAGEPPVFLGFGSMPVLDGDRMLGTIREALARSGRRAVLAAGWSNVAGMSDERLHVTGTVDHDQLMARCSAAIHHGGAGTTRASLRAGLPTWIFSVFADQPFWGARCRALGVGGTAPFTKLDASRLAFALDHLARPEVRGAAGRLGQTLRANDGLARAADYLLTVADRVPVPV